MTLSNIVPVELIKTIGIIEKYNTFNPSDITFNTFEKGMCLIDKNYIYKRVAETITAQQFDANKDYDLYDIVIRNNRLEYISKLIGTTLKQPEEYSVLDEDYKSSNWKSRYLKLGKIEYMGFERGSFASVKYTNTKPMVVKFIKDGNIGYLYAFEILNNKIKYYIKKFKINTNPTFEDEPEGIDAGVGIPFYKDFLTMHNGIPSYAKDAYYFSMFMGAIKYYTINYTDLLPIKQMLGPGAIFTTFNFSKFYVVNKLERDGKYSYFDSVLLEQYVGELDLVDEIHTNTVETKATTTNDPYIFIPNFIIKRGEYLYIRTNLNINRETKEIPNIQTKPLLSLEYPNWGWSKQYPIQAFSPFDIKRYTKTIQNRTIKFIIKAKDAFDTIALSALKASGVEIKIANNEYSIIPSCVYKQYEKTYITDDTVIYYFDKQYNKDTTVEITIQPLNSTVEVGFIALGCKKISGITLTDIAINPKDFSFYEQDEFGNITYKERAKIRRVDYKVEIKTEDFDYTQKLLTDFMGKIIIIDANDNLNNIGNKLNSINMIGRFREPKLRTIQRQGGELEKYAAYNFTAEEII